MNITELNEKQDDVVEKLLKNHKNLLIAECGSGKTWIAKKYIDSLFSSKLITSFLVISPLKVISSSWKHVMSEFIYNNSHVQFLDDSFKKNTFIGDIVVCNREKLKLLKNKKFDLIIIDECSLFKNMKVTYSFAKTLCLNSKYVLLMTATPYTTGARDLLSQLKLINKKPLGNISNVTSKYYTKIYGLPHIYKAKKNICCDLAKDVKDNVIYVNINGDYPCKTNIKKYFIKMNKDIKNQYITMLDYGFVNFNNLFDKINVCPTTPMSKKNKLYQIVNGFVYYDENITKSNYIILDDYKYKCIYEIAKRCEGNVLFMYFFEAEKYLLEKNIPRIQFYKDSSDMEEKWNKGLIKYMGINIGSCSHGLNLQYGGYEIIWCSYPSSFEKFHQSNHRIIRWGQKNDVTIHLPIIKDSVEEDIYKNLVDKHKEHLGFLQNLNSCDDKPLYNFLEENVGVCEI